MTEGRTKISVDKKTNRDLSLLCFRLDIKKAVFLRMLSKVPVSEMRKLLKQCESVEELNVEANSPQG